MEFRGDNKRISGLMISKTGKETKRVIDELEGRMIECEEDQRGVRKEVRKNLKRIKSEVVKEVRREFR